MVSAALNISTRTPQGCCLSPGLFSFYTHDCSFTHKLSSIFTFADDTTIPGLIKGNNESHQRQLVDETLAYEGGNSLVLNTDKTKELILDFRKKAPPPQPLWIKGAVVERVDSFSFLGLHVTNNLSWSENT